MSGHSRWSTIKHKKAIADARKSKGWTKLLKEVTVSARIGGSDISGNFRLRTAIERARAANVSSETIERAIKKGAGELFASQVEELTYQAYGPSNIALIIHIATDNRNRTAAEIRKIIEKGNAKLDSSGSVLRKFKKQGQLWFEKEKFSEQKITEVSLDLGATDIIDKGEALLVLCEPTDYQKIREGFIKNQMIPADSEVGFLAESPFTLSQQEAVLIEKLIEQLEEHEDVLNVYSNHEPPQDANE